MKLEKCFWRWVEGWVGLIKSVVVILSFGFYIPWWDFSFSAWLTTRLMKKALKKYQNKKDDK